jgi:hypothetical protein
MIAVRGVFYRHWVPSTTALVGSTAGGRWSATGTVQTLYLARPDSSAAIDAYRHLVDPFADVGMTGPMVARRLLLEVSVSVPDVVDLRWVDRQRHYGLRLEDFATEVEDYAACRGAGARVAADGASGLIAPAPQGEGLRPSFLAPLRWVD